MTRFTIRSMILALLLFASGPAATLGQGATPNLRTFNPTVTNVYVPLASVQVRILEGDFSDPDSGETVRERVEERVLAEPVTIAGTSATAVEVYEYEDGELTEHTLDYYAQGADGTVVYLGEDVDVYENGKVVDHEGAWRAGEGDNQPGIFMPAAPAEGDQFEQERAPGVAEDQSTVIAVDETITVPAGTFGGCIRTEDVNPLDGETEQKVYCPGVGVVREESDAGALELVAFGSGLPALSATPMAGD